MLSDDIYAPLNYTGQPHATLAALAPDLAERICTISGVSKSHAMKYTYGGSMTTLVSTVFMAEFKRCFYTPNSMHTWKCCSLV